MWSAATGWTGCWQFPLRKTEGLDAIYVDHREAGTLVAEHLVERGYRRFLFIGEESDRKYIGFREALAIRGLAERAESVVYEDDRQLVKFLEGWFRHLGGRTAVFAGNDIFALRVLGALRELEIAVPRQTGISIRPSAASPSPSALWRSRPSPGCSGASTTPWRGRRWIWPCRHSS